MLLVLRRLEEITVESEDAGVCRPIACVALCFIKLMNSPIAGRRETVVVRHSIRRCDEGQLVPLEMRRWLREFEAGRVGLGECGDRVLCRESSAVNDEAIKREAWEQRVRAARALAGKWHPEHGRGRRTGRGDVVVVLCRVVMHVRQRR